jgi:hypothetical protein
MIQRQRASETSVDLRHEPIGHRADAFLEGLPVDRRDLCDVH